MLTVMKTIDLTLVTALVMSLVSLMHLAKTTVS